jgi:uncharacterized membrane protein
MTTSVLGVFVTAAGSLCTMIFMCPLSRDLSTQSVSSRLSAPVIVGVSVSALVVVATVAAVLGWVRARARASASGAIHGTNVCVGGYIALHCIAICGAFLGRASLVSCPESLMQPQALASRGTPVPAKDTAPAGG